MTTTCGSVHACNGERCRQIEVVNATVLQRGAVRKTHASVGLSRKGETCRKGETYPKSYTLGRDLYHALTG